MPAECIKYICIKPEIAYRTGTDTKAYPVPATPSVDLVFFRSSFFWRHFLSALSSAFLQHSVLGRLLQLLSLCTKDFGTTAHELQNRNVKPDRFDALPDKSDPKRLKYVDNIEFHLGIDPSYTLSNKVVLPGSISFHQVLKAR